MEQVNQFRFPRPKPDKQNKLLKFQLPPRRRRSELGIKSFSASEEKAVRFEEMSVLLLLLLFLSVRGIDSERRVIDVKGGPDSVVWLVQLSDLHFSVHHPDRALDFRRLLGPALSIIKPSLVLITGDLTEMSMENNVQGPMLVFSEIAENTSLITVMNYHRIQSSEYHVENEDEWMEYKDVMDDVVRRSGLDKSIFYDLRGNHDNFGVPVVGGSFDFFKNYSISGQLGRSSLVNGVTLQVSEQKHLFVGFDSIMNVGLRGPTNLFGHPTDELLAEIDSELSQWDSQTPNPTSKITFGHFPLSFSASASSGKSLKDIFLKHSVSAYLCGHLHTRFGKNLKRHHQSKAQSPTFSQLFQLNIHKTTAESSKNCSFVAPQPEEFWEWEMGDWRKSRSLRVLAIDRGHVSYTDIDFKTGGRKTIILPTFPLDSRFMSTSFSHHEYGCEHMLPSSYETVRALVFSDSPVESVVAKVYDSAPGHLEVVMEAPMAKHGNSASRGDLYIVPWNYKAFEDPSAERYWLQIEATDVMGRTTSTELRPFSINGLSAKVSWTWKEFFVMGCQWDALYYPILWFSMCVLFLLLLIPKAFIFITNNHFTYKNFVAEKGFSNGVSWVLQELCRIRMVWFGLLGYLFYLILFPWFSGQVFTDGGHRVYMTYKGWVVGSFNDAKSHAYIGSPDVMVVVIPHLLFVVLPSILVMYAFAAERAVYRELFLSLSGKKEDDYGGQDRKSINDHKNSRRMKLLLGERWIRKFLLLLCVAICWKHFKSCRDLMKAYDMNPVVHFPVYSLGIPALLLHTIHKTKKAQ